ncbi:MAG: DNA helicase RecQ [Alphaproteobacteria bacterium]|jgi:ATP-dependent DNA helicase RecQ|tara:strand:+ start:806 stop:2602 length:1797 start_codon:yes stop_codon:yes gene_type:complete
MLSESAIEVLNNTFGYKDFRSGQSDIINAILLKKNILAIMPTGAGKSLCYQIPAIINELKTIVISPLIALMDDQVNALKQNRVSAERLHSHMKEEENNEIWKNFCKGDIKILYMSPEALMRESKLKIIQGLNIGLFVIDEAHCISKWGHGFRKDYENLSKLKDFFPNSNICAFTATADKDTREDIVEKLTGGNCELFLQSLKRPNLSLSVHQKFSWKDQLLKFLTDKKKQSGIVYCLSRKNTETVAEFLNSNGFKSIAYHAGQNSNIRERNQNIFMTETGIVMAATIAFGMGIDKPDVRFVAHISLPTNIEEYYQEIGRAGRDGKSSDTMMIYGLDDLYQRRRFIEEGSSNEDHKRMDHRRLDALLAFCETAACRQVSLLGYFSEKIENCGVCDNCLNPPLLEDGTELAQIVLSAIYRVGQSFGSNYIIDVLMGVKSEKIINNHHDKIKTFGRGKEYKKKFWQSFMRQLISSNHIIINIKKYGIYEITKTGFQLLKSEREFKYKSIVITENSSKKKYKKDDEINIKDEELPLLQRLKELRLELAKKQNVPAFVVFADQTLMHIVETKPQTLDEMKQIIGIGPHKLEKYGKIFLDAMSS